MAFLEDYAGRVDEATARIVELTQNLPDTNSTLDILSQECGGDMSFMPNTLEELENELLLVQSNMNKLVSLASCYSISPLLRRLTHGAVCKESPQGLTWIWGSSLFISICCFVMLTTRAALYNSIKSRKPRDKKSKRAVEKEFEEYKEFMSEYYEDVAEWKLEHSCKKSSILEIDFGSQILLNPTFETASTTKASSDEDAFSQEAEINRSIGPDESTETEPDKLQRIGDNDDKSSSSYDSDYESDSDLSEDSGSDDESALLSFLVETKSILSETKTIISDAKSMASSMVNQTMHKIRNLRPLLAKSKDEDADSDDEQLNGDRGFFFDHDHSPAKSLKIPETGDGLWNKFLTPPSRSGLLGLKTPTAPLKPFSFLGRTSDAAAHELASLTRTPSRDEIRPNHNNRVHPRRLTLSPLIDPIPLEKLHRPQRRPKQKSRLNLGMPTPERPSQTIRRPRFDSNGSDDMSLYVEDAPRPPENVYRRLQRTTDDEQKNRQRVNGNCSSSKTRSSAPSQTKK